MSTSDRSSRCSLCKSSRRPHSVTRRVSSDVDLFEILFCHTDDAKARVLGFENVVEMPSVVNLIVGSSNHEQVRNDVRPLNKPKSPPPKSHHMENLMVNYGLVPSRRSLYLVRLGMFLVTVLLLYILMRLQ